jgi:hypothetical protein
MAQKKEIYKQKLKQTGYWNYDGLYKMTYNWLKDAGYGLSETLYNEKLQGNGKEIVIKWEAKKKVTDYFARKITLDWHILGLNDAEVEIDGKKIKTNKGELEIAFRGIIIKDYEERWEDKPLWKFLRGIYEKYIIRETVDEFEGDMEDDVKGMIADTKAFLRISAR